MGGAAPLSWAAFAAEAPDFAGALHRRLHAGIDGVPIAYLATVGIDGAPHLCPVCPIFREPGLYLCASRRSPKTRDLRGTGVYVLHAFLGENDEEVQVAGRAREVLDAGERAAVHGAIRFASFDCADPIFELAIARASWVHWENAGKPDTRPVRRRWRAR
jgi:hypothetical protein